MTTPAELLESYDVFTPTEVALILRLSYRRGAKRGQPDRKQAVDAMRSGALRRVDPDPKLPDTRWTVSKSEILRFLEHGPRKEAS